MFDAKGRKAHSTTPELGTASNRPNVAGGGRGVKGDVVRTRGFFVPVGFNRRQLQPQHEVIFPAKHELLAVFSLLPEAKNPASEASRWRFNFPSTSAVAIQVIFCFERDSGPARAC
jgi:hypothetical protein